MAKPTGWLKDATKIVRKAGKASTSLLQRKLKIGYTAAAAVIDELEANGIIGPAQGAKPRIVLPESDIPTAVNDDEPISDEEFEDEESDHDEEPGGTRLVLTKEPEAPVQGQVKKMGRPLEYSEKMVEYAKEYLYDIARDESVYVGQGRRGAVISKVNIPSIAGLAIYLDIARSTIYEWAEKHPDFSDILEKIKAEQERRLLNNGLGGQYNSHITKLVLGKHGYHDKQEHMGEGGGPIRHDISGSLRKVYGKKPKPAPAAA